MKRYHSFIIVSIMLSLLGVGVFKNCRYDWSPHYLANRAVKIDKILFSPDSALAVVYYTLDVGARGTREYKSIIKREDFDKELWEFNIPSELEVVGWIDNRTLYVKYYQRELFILEAPYNILDFQKDTVTINRARIVVKERILSDSNN